jgi:hypothetical protein
MHVPMPISIVIQIMEMTHGSGWSSLRMCSPPSVLNWSPLTMSALPEVR